MTLTLHATLAENARRDKVAVIAGEDRVTYAELEREVRRIAGGLAGVKRCGIIAANSAEHVAALLALSAAGIPFVCLDPRGTPAEHEYILDHAGCDAVLADAGHRGTLRIGELAGDAALPAVDERATLRIAYTSGTTGRPKGVVVSQRAQVQMFRQFQAELGVTDRDRTLIPGPLHAIGPFSHALMAVHLGATLILLPRFEPASVLAAIEAERPTVTFMVPTMYTLLLAEPSTADVSSLRVIVSGSAPRHENTRRRMTERFPDAAIYEIYGSTEGGLNTCLPPGAGTGVGRPVAGCEVRLRGQELQVRSPSLADGYHRDPALTAERFIDGGWFRTSDLATIDEDGFVTLLDRADDMIITGGVNVHPTEVEAVLFEHPGVLEAAVFGVPDPKWGEAVTAAVVAHAGASLDGLHAFARARLPGAKCPKRFIVVDELPRSGAGKVLRRELAHQSSTASKNDSGPVVSRTASVNAASIITNAIRTTSSERFSHE